MAERVFDPVRLRLEYAFGRSFISLSREKFLNLVRRAWMVEAERPWVGEVESRRDVSGVFLGLSETDA